MPDFRCAFNTLLSLVLAWCCCVVKADERESFEKLYKDARRLYGVDTRLSPEWLKWEGLLTQAGLELILDELITGEEIGRRELSYFMLDNMSLSREQIADRIMVRAAGADDDIRQFNPYMRILDRYGDEPGVVPFWAKYLSDTRSAEVRPRHPESQQGQTIRVCDVAHGCLVRWLRKKKLWMPGDPGYGDPGGETGWEARNQRIDALNEILLRNKLITAAVRPDPQAVTPSPPPREPKKETTPQPVSPESTSNPWVKRQPVHDEEAPWWPWAVGVVVVSGAFAWWLTKRRPVT